MRLASAFGWGAAVFLIAATSVAQTGGSGGSPNPAPSEVGDATTYSPVGDVLANSVLGNTDVQPIQPGSVKTLLTAVQAFDQNGALAPGVALELTPWNFGAGSRYTFEQYKGSALVRTLKYLSLSFATAKQAATTTTSSTTTTVQPSFVQSAAALRLRLWDDTDWRMNPDLVSCGLTGAQAYLKSLPPPDGAPPNGPPAIVTHDTSAAYKQALSDCLTHHPPAWNGKQLAVGGAFVFDSPDGQLRGTGKDKAIGWGSIAGGPGTDWLFEGSVRYTYHFANALSEAAMTPSSQVLGAALRITWAVSSTLTVRVNGGVGRAWQTGSSFWEIPVGLLSQLKIAPGTWLEAGFTNTWQTSDLPGSVGFVTNFKWIYDTSATPVLPTPGAPS